MKKICYGTSLVLLVLLGCVPSLHELYTDDTVVFDPAIAGRWQQEDGAVWEFVPDEKAKSYQLTIHEKDAPKSKLVAHLVNLDGAFFFDFYPAEDDEIEMGNWIKFHLIPGHLFLRVEQTEPNLVLSAMNADTIGKLLTEKPNMVKHERRDDAVLLTDTPKNLQAFVKAGLKIEKFFSDPAPLKRIPKPSE